MDSLKVAFSKLESHYSDAIEKNCQINLEVMKAGGHEAKEHFRVVQQRAVDLSASYACDLQAFLEKVAKEAGAPPLDFDDFMREEAETLIGRGRPALINFYDVPAIHGKEICHYVSIQEPAARIYREGLESSGVTLPSFARDRPAWPIMSRQVLERLETEL